jgi:hypothetical protein
VAIDKFSTSSKSLKASEVTKKLTEMNTVAEEHGGEVTAKKGDGQHAQDILWAVMVPKGTKKHSGSIPMTPHTLGPGGKNMAPAITAINKAIDYLNGL